MFGAVHLYSLCEKRGICDLILHHCLQLSHVCGGLRTTIIMTKEANLV